MPFSQLYDTDALYLYGSALSQPRTAFSGTTNDSPRHGRKPRSGQDASCISASLSSLFPRRRFPVRPDLLAPGEAQRNRLGFSRIWTADGLLLFSFSFFSFPPFFPSAPILTAFSIFEYRFSKAFGPMARQLLAGPGACAPGLTPSLIFRVSDLVRCHFRVSRHGGKKARIHSASRRGALLVPLAAF